MTWASVPAAATTPVASFGSYLARSITGSDMSPMATTDAETNPVIAERAAPTIMVV